MTLHQWLIARLGAVLDFDGSYGAQCVDAVNDWLRASGQTARATSPTAAGISSEHWPGHLWVPNGPTNAPSSGDVIVWHANGPAQGIGPAGHTAVAIHADRFGLVSADQNWLSHPWLALISHDYRVVAGWQHRIFVTALPLAKGATGHAGVSSPQGAPPHMR